MNYSLNRNDAGKITLDVHMEFESADQALEVINSIEKGRTASSLSSTEVELIPYLKDGQLIQAVKCYKDKTGQGLKESKDFCDRLKVKLEKLGVLQTKS